MLSAGFPLTTFLVSPGTVLSDTPIMGELSVFGEKCYVFVAKGFLIYNIWRVNSDIRYI